MDDSRAQPMALIPLSTSDNLVRPLLDHDDLHRLLRLAPRVTEDTWKSLGTCDPSGPSKGLTTQIDVVGSDGVDGQSLACTVVTRTKN